MFIFAHDKNKKDNEDNVHKYKLVVALYNSDSRKGAALVCIYVIYNKENKRALSHLRQGSFILHPFLRLLSTRESWIKRR